MYMALKFIHILLATFVFGGLMAPFIMLMAAPKKSRRDLSGQLLFLSKWGRHFVWTGLAVGVTGIGLWHMFYTIGQAWVWLSLGLYAVSLALVWKIANPSLAAATDAVAKEPNRSGIDDIAPLLRRAGVALSVVFGLTILILWMMVYKPAFGL